MNAPVSQQQQEQLVLDAPLIALTQKCNGDLRLVLHSFFSFLHRRTDFYCVHNPQDVQEGNRVSMGFREGDAEKLLLAAFRQFPLRRMPPVSQLVSNRKDATSSTNSSSSGTSSDSHKEQRPSTEKTNNDDDHQNNASAKDKDVTKKKKHDDEDEFKIRYTADGHQVPIGNGGSTKQYKWTQTLQEVTIAMPLPSTPPDTPTMTTTTTTTITRAKDLIVEMKPLHICIGKKSETDEKVVSLLLKGELVEKIRPDECTWSIESNVMLITLEKMEKKWWDRIFKEDEERIDLALVDKTHLISDYDEATQGMIRRILFDQRQERLGLSKSDKILLKQQRQQEKGKGDLEKNVREDTGLGALKDCHGNSVEADNLPAGVEFIDKYNFPVDS